MKARDFIKTAIKLAPIIIPIAKKVIDSKKAKTPSK